MTRIKICGITNLADALLAAGLGADALGFVFAESPRRVPALTARRIIRHLPPFIWTVGVFQNQSLSFIRRVVRQCGINAVQLHGDEPPEYCRRLERPVIKAFQVAPQTDPGRLDRAMSRYGSAGCLLDSGGGSGRTFDWKVLARIGRPVIVAGGLGPENVGRLIDDYRPFAVDVSSGVESSPGRKDRKKLARFIAAVRKGEV